MMKEVPPTPTPTPDAVAARLLALLAADPAREGPVLRNRTELSRLLASGERPGLNAALARLEEWREVLVLRRGKSMWYLFAGAMRGWLEGGPGAGASASETVTLEEVYRRLVRESGGFPDVKISALRTALGSMAAGEGLSAELIARWRRGEATLSLGDWSLASEETRTAAVELHGEKYLLVRLEEAE